MRIGAVLTLSSSKILNRFIEIPLRSFTFGKTSTPSLANQDTNTGNVLKTSGASDDPKPAKTIKNVRIPLMALGIKV